MGQHLKQEVELKFFFEDAVEAPSRLEIDTKKQEIEKLSEEEKLRRDPLIKELSDALNTTIGHVSIN